MIQTLTHTSHTIPRRDYMNQRILNGDKAVIFTNKGISYEGTVQNIDGKRYFVLDVNMKLGGLGNCFIMKVKKTT